MSVLAGTLLLLPAWALLRTWVGARLGAVATLLLAFHPAAVHHSTAFMSESLFAALFLYAFLAFSRARDGSGARGGSPAARVRLVCFAGAGLLSALAVLTRPEGWVCVLGFGACTLLPRADGSRVPRWRAALAFGLPPLVLLLPWLLFLRAELGAWSPGAKGPFVFHEAHAASYREAGLEVVHGDVMSLPAPGAGWSAGDYRVTEALRAAPASIAGRMALIPARVLVDKLPSLMTWPLAVAALAWLVLCARDPAQRAPPPPWLARLGLLLGLLVAFYLPLFVLRRYFLPFLPFLLGASVLGIDALGRRATRHFLPGRAGLVTVASSCAVVAAMVASSAGSVREPPGLVVQREAGQLLRAERSTTGRRIVLAGLKPQTAFYAEVEYRRLWETEPERLRAWLAEHAVTHLVLDDAHTRVDHPRLVPWLEPGGEPAWLEARTELERDGHRLVLWRLAPALPRAGESGATAGSG